MKEGSLSKFYKIFMVPVQILGELCQYSLTGVRVMVFNTSFNNISAISLRPVLLVEKIEVPGSKYLEKTTDLLQVTDYILQHKLN
jgi:hypothetical protein